MGGREIRVNTDYRAALATILAYESAEFTPHEQQVVMVRNLLPDVPADLSEDDASVLMQRVSWYLNGGKEAAKDEESEGGLRLHSFSKDAALIFAAFRQTHDIDLASADLHWWTFLALFMDLGSDTAFCQLVALRKRVKTGKASKEERALAREMGDVFDLPELDTRSVEEKQDDNDFDALLAKGRKRRAQAAA